METSALIFIEAVIACCVFSIIEYISLKFHLMDSFLEKFGYYRKDK